MSNMIYSKINYISWKEEAQRIILSQEAMTEKLKEIMASRSKVSGKTQRRLYTLDTYSLSQVGDYISIYLYEKDGYKIYTTNRADDTKNEEKQLQRTDVLFDLKFRELNNGTSLRVAFGYVGKTLKRNIPKQFYYVNQRLLNKNLIASSIDASSQYPSGCLGKLPDMHKAVYYESFVEPNEEYPFAFYASGHLAIYNELDTHNWLRSRWFPYLFRLGKEDSKLNPWPYRPLTKEQEHTILMKASDYTMDSTWQYFYNIKKSYPKDSEEYLSAKLIMNKTIGLWHRKDKDQKAVMTYDNNGSKKLAHIVAVAIARGNQKILDKIEEIGEPYVAHVCVDGIIYLGDRKFGIDKSDLGKFSQEFLGANFLMKGQNVYCAIKDNHCVKFKHATYDLLYDKPIDEDRDFTFEDLNHLSSKENIGDLLNG